MENTDQKFDWKTNLEEKSLEDRWFLDYWHVTECRWVRSPFLTWNQVVRCLQGLTHEKIRNRLDNMTKETFEEVDWKSVRIHSERELDVMVDENGKTEKPYPNDEDFAPVCTKRDYLFGSGYGGIEYLRSGELKEEDIRGFTIPTTVLEDREDVINDLREQYPSGINWKKYDLEMSSYKEKDEGDSEPNLRLVSDNG